VVEEVISGLIGHNCGLAVDDAAELIVKLNGHSRSREFLVIAHV
jgi:hypothetical protein